MLSRPLVGAAMFVVCLGPALAGDAVPTPAAAKPSADKILRQMSDALADARQFSFKGSRTIGASLAASRNLQQTSDFEVTVARPNRVIGTSSNSNGARKLYFDGLALTLFDAKENTYATVPLDATLDELPAQLAKTYGMLPPLADFILSNPYKDMKRRSASVSFIGSDSVGTPPVKSHHLRLAGTVADADLWIGIDDHLPRKLTATVKSGADAGVAVTIEFAEWNLKAPVNSAMFMFVPPKDALPIPMMTTAEMQAAAAKQ